MLDKDPELVGQVNAVFQFDLGGDAGMRVDSVGDGEVAFGRLGAAGVDRRGVGTSEEYEQWAANGSKARHKHLVKTSPTRLGVGRRCENHGEFVILEVSKKGEAKKPPLQVKIKADEATCNAILKAIHTCITKLCVQMCFHLARIGLVSDHVARSSAFPDRCRPHASMATQDGKAEGRASEKKGRQGERHRADKEAGAEAGQPGGTLPPCQSGGGRGGHGKLSGEGADTACVRGAC